MSDKRDEDVAARTLASERYNDYKRGWLSGSNGKPLTPAMDTPKPKHENWFKRGFDDGRLSFNEHVRRIAKDLEMPVTTTGHESNEEPWFDGWATAVGGERAQ